MDGVEDLRPVGSRRLVTIEDFNEPIRIPTLRPRRELSIEPLPRAPPGGPAPDMSVAAEVVVGLTGKCVASEIVAGDHHHPVVIAIPIEQLRDERVEGRVREAVILENDALLLMAEEPVECSLDAPAASEICLREEGAHLAIPVDLGGDPSSLVATRLLISPNSRTVGGNVEHPWLRLPDCLEGLRRQVWSVEDDEENGRHSCRRTLANITHETRIDRWSTGPGVTIQQSPETISPERYISMSTILSFQSMGTTGSIGRASNRSRNRPRKSAR